MDDMQTPSDAGGIEASLDRRSFLTGIALTAGAAASYFGTPGNSVGQIPEQNFRDLIPKSVAGWTAKPTSQLILPAKDDLEKKLYENLETRIYEGPGLPSIMFLIAYSSRQQNDIQVHRPEVCYPVAGFPILKSRELTLNLGTVKINALELVADRQGINEHILYWVRVGDEYPTDFWAQRLAMARSTLMSGIPDGLLFRVSVFEKDPNYNSKSLSFFIQSFKESSPESLTRIILF